MEEVGVLFVRILHLIRSNQRGSLEPAMSVLSFSSQSRESYDDWLGVTMFAVEGVVTVDLLFSLADIGRYLP